MAVLSAVFAGLFAACILLALVSLFKPGTKLALGQKSRPKAFFSWMGLSLLCVVISGMTTPTPKEAPEQTAVAEKQVEYTILDKKEDVRAAIKRNRLHVVIVPAVPQDTLTQQQLADIVMQAAKTLQKESKLPVVSVKMVCQKAANDYGQLMLATVVYIPDGKGYSGSQDLGPWDNLMVAPRGFTTQELEYLRLWAELRSSFQKDDGTDDAALDKAISERMGIAPGSLKPHHNVIQSIQAK